MKLEEILNNLTELVDRYANIPLIETRELSEILRGLGVNISYLVTLRKEYYISFQNVKRSCNGSSEAERTRIAESKVPELDEIRKVLRYYDELRSDIRTQISLWKNND